MGPNQRIDSALESLRCRVSGSSRLWRTRGVRTDPPTDSDPLKGLQRIDGLKRQRLQYADWFSNLKFNVCSRDVMKCFYYFVYSIYCYICTQRNAFLSYLLIWLLISILWHRYQSAEMKLTLTLQYSSRDGVCLLRTVQPALWSWGTRGGVKCSVCWGTGTPLHAPHGGYIWDGRCSWYTHDKIEKILT